MKAELRGRDRSKAGEVELQIRLARVAACSRSLYAEVACRAEVLPGKRAIADVAGDARDERAAGRGLRGAYGADLDPVDAGDGRVSRREVEREPQHVRACAEGYVARNRGKRAEAVRDGDDDGARHVDP